MNICGLQQYINYKNKFEEIHENNDHCHLVKRKKNVKDTLESGLCPDTQPIRTPNKWVYVLCSLQALIFPRLENFKK